MKGPRQAKKVAFPAAVSEVPGLKTREFDAAYKAVFVTKPGRPPNNPQK